MGAGRFLHLIVLQRGVDVVVFLRDPADRLLFEVDAPPGKSGPEPVFAVTPSAGEYVLTVEPLRPEAQGAFVLEVRELRQARPVDRVRAAAEADFARAERRRTSDDFEAAAPAYRQAFPRLVALGEPRRAAEAEWHLGEALLETGELRQAAADLERAAARFRALGDGVGEARALTDLGDAWRRLGEPRAALAAHQRSLHLYRDAGNVPGQATAQNNLGLVFETTGELQAAIGRYEAALMTWRRTGDKSAQAATLQNLGSLYNLIGYDDEALDLLRQGLALLSGNANEKRRTGVLIALGWAEYLAGQPRAALDRYREAIALAERSGDRLAQAGAWDRRGSALRVLHRYQEAADSYSRALAGSRAAGSRLSEGNTLANLGTLDLETGAVARGRERLRQAAKLLAASGDPNGEVYARVGLSRAERQLGDFGSARQQVEAAIGLVEGLRAGLRGPVSRGHFLATRYDAYEELVTLLMELDRREPATGYARQALDVAERARARNLLDEMATGREETSTVRQTEQRRQSLLAEVRAIDERRQALADRDPQDPRLHSLDAALRARGLELDQLTETSTPRPILAPMTAAQIQDLADQDSLFVVYLLAEPASFAWTVDRDQVVTHVLPGRERIEKLSRRVVAALSQSRELAAQGTATQATQELSQAILVPLGQRLAGRRRLVLLADGALHLVPFAALPSPRASPAEAAEPLLVRHEIVMLPSATVLSWQRRRLAERPPAPGRVAVLADPLYSLADPRLAAGKGPRPVSPAAGNRQGFDLGSFHRLPYTAEEAKAIVRLVPRGKAFLAMGPTASRELVLSGALSRYRSLHFATHGLLHPVLPERSGLVLSLYDEKGERRDGFLSAPDVATLNLPAELAVLSGCQTGLGRELRGEGLVGLSQAFFRAGTRRVVVSAWNVQDRATAELMARFYRKLLVDHISPAAALRAAQLAVRAEERWRSPYYWAGFSLHGEFQ